MPLFILDRCGWACNMSCPLTPHPPPTPASSPGSGGGVEAEREKFQRPSPNT